MWNLSLVKETQRTLVKHRREFSSEKGQMETDKITTFSAFKPFNHFSAFIHSKPFWNIPNPLLRNFHLHWHIEKAVLFLGLELLLLTMCTHIYTHKLPMLWMPDAQPDGLLHWHFCTEAVPPLLVLLHLNDSIGQAGTSYSNLHRFQVTNRALEPNFLVCREATVFSHVPVFIMINSVTISRATWTGHLYLYLLCKQGSYC